MLPLRRGLGNSLHPGFCKFGFQILKNGGKPEITDNELDGEAPSKKTMDFDPDNVRVQITPKGRRAEPRDKDSTPRQKRDK